MTVHLTYPVREATGALQALGLIFTAWRIYFRMRIGRFWWEDAWAVAAFVACTTSVVGQWVYLLTDGMTAIVGSWCYSLGFTFTVRAVHMSILFSIMRIIRPRLRQFTHACVAFFAACWAVLITLKIWQCSSDRKWYHHKPPACLMIRQTLILELISDCIAVAILIALPLRLLWNVKLPRRQRRMILSIFASSIVLAFAAIAHIVGHVTHNHLFMIAGIGFEIALSIIVCNLLVIVTFVSRFLLRGDSSAASRDTSSSETDDFTQPTRRIERTALTMTPIEVDCDFSTASERSDISLQNILVSTGTCT